MLNLLTREPLIGSVRTSLGRRKKKSRMGGGDRSTPTPLFTACALQRGWFRRK